MTTASEKLKDAKKNVMQKNAKKKERETLRALLDVLIFIPHADYV